VSGGEDSKIFIWDDYLNSSSFSYLTASGPVFSLNVLNGGNLVSGTGNGYVEFWDTYDLKQINYWYQGEHIVTSLSTTDLGDLIICLSNGQHKTLNLNLQISSLTIFSNRNPLFSI
jgi:hypothetical protein